MTGNDSPEAEFWTAGIVSSLVKPLLRPIEPVSGIWTMDGRKMWTLSSGTERGTLKKVEHGTLVLGQQVIVFGMGIGLGGPWR